MNNQAAPRQFSRRTAIALASILIAALLLCLFLPPNTGAYRALPAQTSLLLDCKGLLRVKSMIDKTSDQPWHDVLHSTLFNRCFADAAAVVKLLGHDPNILRAFAKNRALAAFSLHAADSLHGLFALELDEGFNLEKTLKTNRLTPKYFPHQFRGNTIFNVHLSRVEQIEVAVSGKLLLFSRKATLVEDALAQLEHARHWWTDRPRLSELPEGPLRIQFRPAAFAEQWRQRMHPRWRGLPDLLAANLEWYGLSWDGESACAVAETKGFFGGLGSWGEAPGQGIFKVLPDNTALLARAGLANTPAFFREIADNRSSDFEQFVLPWVGREAAVAITEPLSPALAGDRLLLFAVRDSAGALKSLRAFGKARGMLPMASGPYQMFEVMGFQSSSLLRPVLGDDEAFRNPVCCLVEGYAIFAPDRSSLEVFLDKYIVNQTLANNTDFLQLQQKLPRQGHASFLLNTAFLPSLLQNVMGARGESELARTGFVAAECVPRFGRKAEILLANQAQAQALPRTDVLWKSVLAAPAITQPYLLEQPDGKTVLLIQDLKFNLYCLDAQNGALRWNKALQERILSPIQGIDYFGNGTKCCIFSSPSQLYALDENGRDLQGFPLILPDKATNAVTVVDFDKNTQLSYFVACENGKIYGFGHLGKPLDGWNGISPNGSAGDLAKAEKHAQNAVRQPILHFQYRGKDYLAVLTETGMLSVFGRDGNLRFPPLLLNESPAENNAADATFKYPLQVDPESPDPRIYCASSNGKVFACDLHGKWKSRQAGRQGSMVAFGQLLGDARFELAVLDGNNLSASNWETPIFKTQFAEKQHLVFFLKQQYVGIVDKQGRRLWLLDSKGETMPGFPLGGNTVFELGRLNGVDMLVTGNGNSVWAYRYGRQ